jgi:hypothetical protein
MKNVHASSLPHACLKAGCAHCISHLVKLQIVIFTTKIEFNARAKLGDHVYLRVGRLEDELLCIDIQLLLGLVHAARALLIAFRPHRRIRVVGRFRARYIFQEFYATHSFALEPSPS